MINFKKAFEVAENENNKSYVLNWALKHSMDMNSHDLIVNDFGFIETKEEKLLDFKRQLKESNIQDFIITETSTALMRILHALSGVDIVIDKLETITIEENLIGTKRIKEVKGIRMRVL